MTRRYLGCLAVWLLVASCGGDKDAPKSAAVLEPDPKGGMIIHPSVCRMRSGSWTRGLGSDTVRVRGHLGDDCVFDNYNETEGGYSEARCKVPKTAANPIAFRSAGDDEMEVTGMEQARCKPLRSGNLLLEKVDIER